MSIGIGRAAKLIGIKPNAVYQMIKKGTIPYERGVVFERSVYRIPLHQLQEWLEREMSILRKRIDFLSRSQKQIQEVLKHG